MIPDLFLILVDQNILKADSVKKKYISEFLILLLQSLPSGSYYQIIGFGYGSNNKINDEQPKEYNQKNIEESIKSLEKLEGYMNANDLYEALNYIYIILIKFTKKYYYLRKYFYSLILLLIIKIKI